MRIESLCLQLHVAGMFVFRSSVIDKQTGPPPFNQLFVSSLPLVFTATFSQKQYQQRGIADAEIKLPPFFFFFFKQRSQSYQRISL